MRFFPCPPCLCFRCIFFVIFSYFDRYRRKQITAPTALLKPVGDDGPDPFAEHQVCSPTFIKFTNICLCIVVILCQSHISYLIFHANNSKAVKLLTAKTNIVREDATVSFLQSVMIRLLHKHPM